MSFTDQLCRPTSNSRHPGKCTPLVIESGGNLFVSYIVRICIRFRLEFHACFGPVLLQCLRYPVFSKAAKIEIVFNAALTQMWCTACWWRMESLHCAISGRAAWRHSAEFRAYSKATDCLPMCSSRTGHSSQDSLKRENNVGGEKLFSLGVPMSPSNLLSLYMAESSMISSNWTCTLICLLSRLIRWKSSSVSTVSPSGMDLSKNCSE